MDLLFIISAPLVGYYLNRNGKQSREVRDSIVLQPNASGYKGIDLLSTGNRSVEVRDHVQTLAAKKHPKKLRSMYGSAIDAPTNIFPENELSGFVAATPHSFEGSIDDSAAARFERQVGLIRGGELLAYDPATGAPAGAPAKPKPSNPTQNVAAFRNWAVKGNESQPLSPLTGLPADLTHANMQPFFGKHSFAGDLNSPNRDTLLERFTGRSADFTPRKEEVNTNILTPNKFPDPSLTAAQSTAVARAVASVRPSNEYVKPFKGFRDMPDISSSTRVLPPNIDALRGAGHEKQVYGGGVILGQLGSTRPMQPSLQENRFELAPANSELLPTQAAFTMGSLNAEPSPSQRPTYENDYMGVPTFPLRSTGADGMTEGLKSTMDATVNRRQDTWTPAFSAPTGKSRPSTQGIITARDPEKGHEGGGASRGSAHQSINNRLRNVSAPGTTARELTQENPHVGHVNPSAGTRTDGSYKITNPVLPITNKGMNSDSSYIGPASGGKLYPMQQNFDLGETYKEMNCVSVMGNPDKGTRLPPVKPEVNLVETFKAMNSTEQRGNPVGRTRAAPGKPAFDELPTMKETTLHSVTGNPQARMRSAPVIGSHEKNTATDREMNSAPQSGAPRALVPSHMSYDAVFELSDATVETGYVSVPRNPTWGHTRGPGENTSGTKESLTAERFGNPESREKRHEVLQNSRENTRLSGREVVDGQMGNPYHPNAAMSGHEAEVSLKDGLVVEGRFEPALMHDGKKDRVPFSFDLRDDPQSQSITGVARTLPRALKSPEPGMSVRSVNSESLNPRFDPGLRIPRLTSDLYPVVSDSKTN